MIILSPLLSVTKPFTRQTSNWWSGEILFFSQSKFCRNNSIFFNWTDLEYRRVTVDTSLRWSLLLSPISNFDGRDGLLEITASLKSE
uniref:Uncharacterized protein n=1 Tax=Lepeophtheirus salmonis TaxID=72036 RepID=A0A0K2TC88_LEPSM